MAGPSGYNEAIDPGQRRCPVDRKAAVMMSTAPLLGFLGPIGWPEMLVIAVVGLLFFGKRLPEVGRSLGRGIVEFKKGLSGLESEVKRSGEPPRLEEHAEGGQAGEKTTKSTQESA